jgi:leader peptidase (prepilin peptidase)/N-methyltransferase
MRSESLPQLEVIVTSLDTSASAPEAAGGLSVVRTAATVCAGATIVAVAQRFGFSAELLPAAAFAVTLALISVIDFEQRRIPNVIVVPAAAVGLLAVALLQPDRLKWSIAGGVAACLFFLIPALVLPRAVGMGDAKLGLLIGVILGADVVQALFVTSFAAGAVAAVLIVMGGANRKRTIPLGPFLALGAIFALIASGGSFYP